MATEDVKAVMGIDFGDKDSTVIATVKDGIVVDHDTIKASYSVSWPYGYWLMVSYRVEWLATLMSMEAELDKKDRGKDSSEMVAIFRYKGKVTLTVRRPVTTVVEDIKDLAAFRGLLDDLE